MKTKYVKNNDVKLKYEITLLLTKGYELKKTIEANNEHEAILILDDILDYDLNMNWNRGDYKVINVVSVI